ncbi:MAG: hypothetical protein GXO47_14085, partial [Chlorobi bacterium]|nr:hypothetical protein [Chlorobiota bacterium]
VPTIAIAYQEKSNQFMKSFGVRENSINLKELEEEAFMEIFDRVISNPEKYSLKERESLDEIVAKAEENNKLLFDLIKK